jgi:large subunit ribosomal protein L17
LIEHERIKTTLAKAKAVRPLAERMVTLGKNGSLHARRTAMAVLRQKNAVKKLFDSIAPRSAERSGGYTRIVKLGQRRSDSAPVAFLEWVDAAPATEEKEPKKKQGKEKPAKAEKETSTTSAAVKPTPPAAEAKAEPKAEPKAEAKPAAEEKSATPPAEEPKKKRKWFGRKDKG